MTILAQLNDCHSCNDARSIVQKKNHSKAEPKRKSRCRGTESAAGRDKNLKVNGWNACRGALFHNKAITFCLSALFLSVAFGSSCLGSKAHQRALGGQWKGSCSLSYFPVGSERCWREVGPFVHSWVELSCRELDFWRVVVLFSSLSIPCIPGREVGLFRKAVCSFCNFSFKAWAWITYRLDRVRCWREVVPYLHIPGDFPGRGLFSISELVCVEGLCSILELLCAQWQS